MDLTATPGYVPGFPDELSLRELGGIAAADGRVVRHGLLYRGAALVGLTDGQRAAVDAFDLRFILDLRAAGEIVGKPDYVPEGCEYVRIGGMVDAVGEEVDFSPAGIARLSAIFASEGDRFMRSLYASMAFGNPAAHALMQRFVAGQAPLYFHCTAGKDRTGVCAALLLLTLGVSDEAIVQEFLLTNEYRARIINMTPEEMPAGTSPDRQEKWAQINSVNEGDLRAVLAAIDERYPTREAYLASEFGLDAEMLARVRDRYLE